jgi:hypothetical protein
MVYVSETIEDVLEGMIEEISAGIDTGDRIAIRLGTILMKAAVTRYCSILNAEIANIRIPDPDRRQIAIARADERFQKIWDWALSQGTAYTGPTSEQVSATIDGLITEILNQVL